MGRRVLVTWDVGGQTSLRPMWDKYFSEAHAVVFVVDMSDHTRMEEARVTFHQMVCDPRLVGAPILLLCNKMDKDEAIEPDIIADAFDIQNVRDHTVYLAPIVALSGSGVQEAFSWLIEELKTSPRDISHQ